MDQSRGIEDAWEEAQFRRARSLRVSVRLGWFTRTIYNRRNDWTTKRVNNKKRSVERVVSINYHHSFRVVAEIEESKGEERWGKGGGEGTTTLRSNRKPLRKSKLVLRIRFDIRKTRCNINVMCS